MDARILDRVRDARRTLNELWSELHLASLHAVQDGGPVQSLATAAATCDAACLLMTRVVGTIEGMVGADLTDADLAVAGDPRA